MARSTDIVTGQSCDPQTGRPLFFWEDAIEDALAKFRLADILDEHRKRKDVCYGGPWCPHCDKRQVLARGAQRLRTEGERQARDVFAYLLAEQFRP